MPFLPQWGGTIPCQWVLRFLVVSEIDCGNWLAREYMPAHQHYELFYPFAGDLIGSTLNEGGSSPPVQDSLLVPNSGWSIGC